MGSVIYQVHRMSRQIAHTPRKNVTETVADFLVNRGRVQAPSDASLERCRRDTADDAVLVVCAPPPSCLVDGQLENSSLKGHYISPPVCDAVTNNISITGDHS